MTTENTQTTTPAPQPAPQPTAYRWVNKYDPEIGHYTEAEPVVVKPKESAKADEPTTPAPEEPPRDNVPARQERVEQEQQPVEGYDLQLNVPVAMRNETVEQTVREFGVVAREVGLSQDEAQRVLNLYIERSVTTPAGLDTRNRGAVETHLKSRWGEHYAAKMAAVKRAVAKLGDRAVEFLDRPLPDGRQLGNDPHVLEILAEIGEGAPSMAKSEAARELASIMADSKHAYWKADHKGHKAAVERVRLLVSLAGDHGAEDVGVTRPTSVPARREGQTLQQQIRELERRPEYLQNTPEGKALRERVAEMYRRLYPSSGEGR